MYEEHKNLPYLYWTPKLHKVPFKHHFIAGSSKCTTQDLTGLVFVGFGFVFNVSDPDSQFRIRKSNTKLKNLKAIFLCFKGN